MINGGVVRHFSTFRGNYMINTQYSAAIVPQQEMIRNQIVSQQVFDHDTVLETVAKIYVYGST